MELFYGIVVFVFGLVFGSFLNVCIYRIPTGESVAAGRSHCMSCGRTIKWYDLVPVLSWCVLGGRCRFCGAKISPRYAAVELGNALLWLAAYGRYGLTLRAAVCAAAISVLIVAGLIDWDTKLIYDRFDIVIAALAVVSAFADTGIAPLSRLIGALCVSVPMLLLALFTGGFGGGDVKLAAACGLLLGWQNMLAAAFVSVVAGGAFAVCLLAAKKAGRGGEMPFGPFIALGVITALLAGDMMVGWYAALCQF